MGRLALGRGAVVDGQGVGAAAAVDRQGRPEAVEDAGIADVEGVVTCAPLDRHGRGGRGGGDVERAVTRTAQEGQALEAGIVDRARTRPWGASRTGERRPGR